MKTKLDCYSCFVRQALDAARVAGVDEVVQQRVMNAVLDYLSREQADESPVYFVQNIQRIVGDITGVSDAFVGIKQDCNERAMGMMDMLQAKLAGLTGLSPYLRFAIAGNVIDYGPATRFDLESTLDRCLTMPLAINHEALLERRLRDCRRLAYLADNAGEIVFDRLLLQHLIECYDIEEVLFVVRERPFLNDALLYDAKMVGITELDRVRVVQMDAGVPRLEDPAYATWRDILDADVRIAKGQANAEGLEDQQDFFLLFMVKCELIARIFGAKAAAELKLGDMLLLNTSLPC
jgi:uncharacterized protein with ATP-grasp and redox domains